MDEREREVCRRMAEHELTGDVGSGLEALEESASAARSVGGAHGGGRHPARPVRLVTGPCQPHHGFASKQHLGDNCCAFYVCPARVKQSPHG